MSHSPIKVSVVMPCYNEEGFIENAIDSSIKVIYFPRSSLKGLVIQYFKYGKGRCYTTLKHKRVTSIRQIAPLVIVAGFFSSLGLSVLNPLFLSIPAAYVLSLLFVAFTRRTRHSLSIKEKILLSCVFFIIYIFWGLGFFFGLFRFENLKHISHG